MKIHRKNFTMIQKLHSKATHSSSQKYAFILEKKNIDLQYAKCVISGANHSITHKNEANQRFEIKLV